MPTDTIQEYGQVDISLEKVDLLPKPSAVQFYMEQPVVLRVRWRGEYGREDHKLDLRDFEYGLTLLKRELALLGKTELPEARLWGKKVKAIGSEGGVLTVHLEERRV